MHRALVARLETIKSLLYIIYFLTDSVDIYQQIFLSFVIVTDLPLMQVPHHYINSI